MSYLFVIKHSDGSAGGLCLSNITQYNITKMKIH